MTGSEPLLETKVLDRLEGDVGARVVTEIIELFLGHGPEKLEAARDGRRSGDLKAIADALHSIKSSAAMFGASRLRDLTERLEERAVEGDTAAVEELFGTFEETFAKTIDLLRERVSG
jgi:two-component system phosphorelay protein LuxU